LILVDTSAWVEFLRDTGGPVCTRVDELLAGDIATCDPVRMEVLAGARDEGHLNDLRRLLARAAVVEAVTADYEQAAALYRTCRHGGETVRKLIDCLIGAIAIRADVPVLHSDNDFEGADPPHRSTGRPALAPASPTSGSQLASTQRSNEEFALGFPGPIEENAWVMQEPEVATVDLEQLFWTGYGLVRGTRDLRIGSWHLVLRRNEHQQRMEQVRGCDPGVKWTGRRRQDPCNAILPSAAVATAVLDEPPERLDGREQ
jgi:predicted nucleic acid-binding protein